MNRKFIHAAAFLAVTVPMNMRSQDIAYPAAPKDGTVDDYFGIKVADPYRPLEDDTAAGTLEWVRAENEVTDTYLARIPFREGLRRRLTQLNDYHKAGLPSKENDGMYYFFENDGLRNQAVLYRVRALGDEPEVFLDPNKLSSDGTVALTGVFMSPDGKYTAYTISRSGSDWSEIYVMDTASGLLLDDHIEWAKFTGAAWKDDGFYYSAYSRPEGGKEFSSANEYHRVYYHRIGTSQSEDTVAFEDPGQPLHFHQAQVPDDGSALFITVSGQGNGNSLLVKDLRSADARWQVVEPSQDYDVSVVDVIDGTIYLYTSVGAPLYRIVAVPLASAADRSTWKEIVPQQKNVLVGAKFASGRLLLTYDRDASNHVCVYSADGSFIREIGLPTFGTVGISCRRDSGEVFYSFSSFTCPSAIYSYDMETGNSVLYKSASIAGFDMDDYVTEQVFYTSADGTEVPMFLTYKKGLERNGRNPVYLYGYGGFNITLNPGFSANRLLWLENGGIYAQANLRGGGEYGEYWHIAGTKMQKLNVFDDFIAAAQYMISSNWTTPDLLTIEGGSNGGLLVGACVNIRPDLFRVAIPRVGVMDMMRYHLFTIGWNWAHDYGTSADSPEMAAYLLGYSPLHNIRNDGTRYPSILVTTADHDDRVVPAHSFKYAATIQSADTGDRPRLIRIDSKAGHGAGKPVAKVIDEWTDIYSFIFYNIGINPVIK